MRNIELTAEIEPNSWKY